ncbi:unnamed protein product [Choristocarpus tenellus]
MSVLVVLPIHQCAACNTEECKFVFIDFIQFGTVHVLTNTSADSSIPFVSRQTPQLINSSCVYDLSSRKECNFFSLCRPCIPLRMSLHTTLSCLDTVCVNI